MRRNLRLDWRALALLGALLSIIIDWPAVVYAMPTILPAEPTGAAAAATAPTDTLQTIKNDSMFRYFPLEDKNSRLATYNKRNEEFKGSQIKNTNFNSFFNEAAMSELPTLASSTVFARETDTVKQSHQQQRLTTGDERQLTNEKLSSISDKEINDTIIKAQQNKQLEITAISEPLEQLNAPLKVGATESAAVVQLTTLINTHIKNSTFNTLSLSKSISMYQPTTSSTLAAIATTESSAKIQSTLMPTTSADQSDDLSSAPSLNSNLEIRNLLRNFKFSSSHHLAILSRTERSIRSPATSSSLALTLPLSDSRSSRSSARIRASRSGSGGVKRSTDANGLKSKRLNNSRNLHHKNNLDRNERSTVSHLSGPSRKIQLYIKNRFLQLLPDGTVNGTQDEQCDYTILQRSTVEVGRIKVQGVATCLYLCMDPCGAVYGSKEFTDDCVFNESMEQHNYNTYSSTYNSNARRKYYLALNRHGEPRKLQIPPSRSLGKLATYTNAIPETVPQERVEQLIAKNFGANRVKHGIRQLCDTGKPLIELIDSKNFKARPKCNANNSNNNSNSKNSLSRNLDRDISLGGGQVLNSVPVANDKNNLSSSRSSSSSSSIVETNKDSNSSSSSSSPSSISINQNNGHIRSSSSSSSNKHSSSSSSNSHGDSSVTMHSNSTALQAGSHRGGKKTGKKRKCRRFENEQEHNCTTPLNRPTSFTKRGNQLGPIRQQKCRDLLLQQQQAQVTDIVLPPMCTKKGGFKKQQGHNRKAQGKNTLGSENRRSKKLNVNRGGNAGGSTKHTGKNNSNNSNNNAGPKKKQKNSKRGNAGGNNNPNNNNNSNHNRKNNRKSSSTTTEKTAAIESTSFQSSALYPLRPKSWETTSLLPSTTLYNNYDPQSESTSDRGDREQRNARYSNSMEEYLEQSSEDTSAAEDPDDDDNDLENNDDGSEDDSYEDDTYSVPISSSLVPYTASESSQTPLTAGADDFLYYDQIDSRFSEMHHWAGLPSSTAVADFNDFNQLFKSFSKFCKLFQWPNKILFI